MWTGADRTPRGAAAEPRDGRGVPCFVAPMTFSPPSMLRVRRMSCTGVDLRRHRRPLARNAPRSGAPRVVSLPSIVRIALGARRSVVAYTSLRARAGQRVAARRRAAARCCTARLRRCAATLRTRCVRATRCMRHTSAVATDACTVLSCRRSWRLRSSVRAMVQSPARCWPRSRSCREWLAAARGLPPCPMRTCALQRCCRAAETAVEAHAFCARRRTGRPAGSLAGHAGVPEAGVRAAGMGGARVGRIRSKKGACAVFGITLSSPSLRATRRTAKPAKRARGG